MKAFEKAISFLPLQLLSWISDGIHEKRFPAVVAFADVSGFTKMSEQLATIGREGAEALTGILNSYFTQMISRIETAGGFVGKFGGDAMTIFFPVETGEEMADVAQRAVITCVDLQKLMKDFENVETKAGSFTLGMKIGIASGDVLFKVVGPETDGGREYLLAGYPLDQAAEAEHHGVSGQVILTSKVAAICKACGEELDAGFMKLDPEKILIKCEPKPFTKTPESGWTDIARLFIDPAVYHRMALGMDSVGEIRRVSVIFMSFTGLDYDVDMEVGQKLEDVYEWVYRVVSQYGGSINKVDMGDKGSKMIITFGTPTAHENDEELALHCGLKLVGGHKQIRKLGVEGRIGIASGVVFAGEVGAPSRQEYTVMGSVVNLSARLMAHSKPGQLLVDEASYSRAQKVFKFSKPVNVKFKGIKEPLPVYSVKGQVTEIRQTLETERKPLIGRDAEVKELKDSLQSVIDGALKVFILRGDAGTGKTRLAQETLELSRKSGFRIAAGEALSYAKRSPYLIWISILRRLMGLPAAGSRKDAVARLEGVVREADPEHPYRVPIVAGLLGIDYPDNEITRHFDAQLRQENLFDFLLQYLRHLCSKSPLLLLFEDAQWIDKNSLALIAYTIRNLKNLPINFLIVRRHYSRQFSSPDIATIEKNAVTSIITLNEFSREDAELLTLKELEVVGIDQDLMNFIFDSSHGNASYIEQLIENLKSVDRIKIVQRDDLGGMFAEKVGKLSDVEVPDSLSSLIMSQLDRLKPEAKLTIRLASAIGRQFQREVVEGSYPVEMQPEQIHASLNDLKSHDLIVENIDEDLLNYIFKNLLTLDVAYDSLLFAHRREYHHRIGLTLEALHTESLFEWYEELARHFSLSDDDNRAINYLGKAGNKAFDIYANESAEDLYSQALERASSGENPDERFRLLSMRTKVYAITGKSDLQKQDLDEMLNLADVRNDKKGKVSTLSNLARYFQRAHELQEMKRAIDEAQVILEEIDFPFGRITINSKAGSWYFMQNKYEDALKCWKMCNEESAKIGDEKGLSVALTNCGLALKALGDIDTALQYYNQSVEIDRKIGNRKSEAVNLGNIGSLHHSRGDFDKALQAYEQTLDIARSIGSKQIQSYYLGNLAVIYQTKGKRDKALTSYEDMLGITRQMGYLRGEVLSLSNLGAWYLEFGDFERAVAFFEEALKLANSTGLKGQIPQIMINVGLAKHYCNDLDKAEETLEQAASLAVEVKSKPAEDYSRRYLGFVLIDKGEIDRAEEQFRIALGIAEGLGSKVSIASAKIGLGWINMLRGGDSELIREGLEEAKKIGENETIIKGYMGLAKSLLKFDSASSEAKELLTEALEIAENAGQKCDVSVIKSLIETY